MTKISEFCQFLAKFPSMWEMEQAGATAVEFRQAVVELQGAARAWQEQLEDAHPLHQLLRIYAGCSQADFEANKDVACKFARSWVEDLVFTHAWVFPDLRRSELGDLLLAVARRHQDESIDDVDRGFIATLKCDVPGLLKLLSSMPEKFPQYFMVHLVDLLYYAGRLPLSSETGTPPRDQHLIAYAEDLRSGEPKLWRYGLNYLRAGAAPETGRFLATLADEYCASAVEDDQALWQALGVLEDLEMSELGYEHCWRRAQHLKGQPLHAIAWACWAVVAMKRRPGADAERITRLSDFCDELAKEDMGRLLEELAPANLEESFDDCPSYALLASLVPVGAPRPLPSLPASARLYFYIQYARCHALQKAKRPAASWAPVLVKLLSHGFASSFVQLHVLKEELATALDEDPSPFEPEEVLALMRIANDATSGAKCSTQELQDLHRSLGMCLSRAILQGSGRLGSTPPSPLLMA
ncbi:unnamed protein product [Effrenium voratum]|nr:unnamed protein product [Effrenium voratum]